MTDNQISDIVYDSLQQCAAATGIPLSLLKEAKTSGCPAFVSTRILLQPLIQWLFKSGKAADVDGAKARLVLADAELAEAKARAQSGENDRKADAIVKAVLTKVLSPLRVRLLAFPALLSARVNPSDPELARVILEESIDALLKSLPHD